MSRLLKRLHPQGIPWPASLVYNRLSLTRIFRAHYEMVARETAAAIRASGIPGPVLDLDTGPGYLLHALSEHLPDRDLIGMDISPAMAAQAGHNLRGRPGSRHQQRISFVCTDAADLPLKPESAACIVSTGSFHHWRQPEAVLNRAWEVLKPGGWALIYDLVRHLPRFMRKKIRKEFGRFRLALLWLHSFEEPFSDPDQMAALVPKTPFCLRETRFTGGLCCLVLSKT